MNMQRRHIRFLSPAFISFVGEQFYRLNRPQGYTKRDLFASLEKILVLRLDKIGDVVMTSAFLRELRHNYPEAFITLVVNPTTYNLAQHCPYVDNVLIFPWESYSGKNSFYRHWRTLMFARKHLQPQRFDAVMVPRWDVDFYLENYLAFYSGAPLKLAHTEMTTPTKRILNKGENKLFTQCVNDVSLQHEVDHALNMLRFIGGTIHDDNLEIWPTKDDELAVKKMIAAHLPVNQNPLFCIGIGAGDSKRIWPVDRYAEVCKWLHEMYGGYVFVVGANDEYELGADLTLTNPGYVSNVTGKLTLRQTAVLLKHSTLFIGNDSGPMHIAAAARTPVIEISPHPRDGDPAHFNSPVRFGPWNIPSEVLQPATALSPCVDSCSADKPHCIRQITIQEVQNAIQSLLYFLPQRPR